MKRSELTYKKMQNMGWKATTKTCDLEDIVHNIKARDTDGTYLWKYLRCWKSENSYTQTEYGMCSTYENRYKTETLEVSTDGKTWFEVAERPVCVGSRCVYAD